MAKQSTCRRCGDTATTRRMPGAREVSWRATMGWVRYRTYDLLGREKPGRTSITLCPTCVRDLNNWLNRRQGPKPKQPPPEAGAARVVAGG